MNFIENESPRKLRGGFYTAPDIARFLAKWALQHRPKSVLEPSCGDGAFLAALVEEQGNWASRIVGWELNPEEAAKARERTPQKHDSSIEVHTGDFLKWFLFHADAAERVDAVVGNPPFIRYQYLGEEQQGLTEKIFARYRLSFTKHTNAWVPFVIGSLALLAPGGRLAMVVPSEILHIRHAEALRQFLLTQCARVLLLDPEELWFEDAQQGVVLLLAEKKLSATESTEGVAVRAIQERDALSSSAAGLFAGADFTNGTCTSGKWMRLLLSAPERSLLDRLRNDPRFSTFNDLAEVDVGIVTGANDFFLVPDAVVRKYGLQPWVRPMFGRSEHVAGLIYGETDHEANRNAEVPSNFLWFDSGPAAELPKSVQAYLRLGEELGLPQRYKCRIREPWYRVPSVYAAPVAMLKRAHHYPRLVWNEAGAFTTDTAYRVKAKRVTPVSLVYSFLNSLTSLCAELEGRHYGGGVLELVPSEIERLLLPIYTASPEQLRQLDRDFRSSTNPAQALRAQDAVVLQSAGLDPESRSVIHAAWDRLRQRRQRSRAKAPADP